MGIFRHIYDLEAAAVYQYILAKKEKIIIFEWTTQKLTGQLNMCALAPRPASIHRVQNGILQMHYEPSNIPA